ncbi:MAG: helix-hairpin-helix domain-containing protein [Pseudomonadota bacterium]
MPSQSPPDHTARSQDICRQARAYLSSLRQARMQRLRAQAQSQAVADATLVDPAVNPAAQPATPEQEKPRPKIGKRGVRVTSTAAPSASSSIKSSAIKRAKTQRDINRASTHGHSGSAAERAQDRLEQRQQAREAIRQGATKIRQAAHDAQQKVRAARKIQRENAAKALAGPHAAKGRPQPVSHQAIAPPDTACQPPLDLAEASDAVHLDPVALDPVDLDPVDLGTSDTSGTITAEPSVGASPNQQGPSNGVTLTDITGIGDAMSRRLETAGIGTVAALLAEHPDSIRALLGPVSSLANVEAWQDQAASLLQNS